MNDAKGAVGVNAWNLITLNATKILCNLTERNLIRQDGNFRVNFCYDLSDKNGFGREIISSEDSFVDNALFFQLRKVLPEGTEVAEKMRAAIVFVDFKEVFEDDLSMASLGETTPSKADLLSDNHLDCFAFSVGKIASVVMNIVTIRPTSSSANR